MRGMGRAEEDECLMSEGGSEYAERARIIERA